MLLKVNVRDKHIIKINIIRNRMVFGSMLSGVNSFVAWHFIDVLKKDNLNSFKIVEVRNRCSPYGKNKT